MIVPILMNEFHKLMQYEYEKLHFLDLHQHFFPKNCDDFSREQEEQFHQDIKTMETKQKGQRNVNIIANYYCWSMKRDIRDAIH